MKRARIFAATYLIYKLIAGLTVAQCQQQQLLDKIQQEKPFETLVIYAESKQPASNCISNEVLKNVTHTHVMLQVNNYNNTLQTATKLDESQINKELLVFYCISKNYTEHLMQGMLQHLGALRSARFVFYWNAAFRRGMHQEQLLALFRFCKQHSLLNVIALYADAVSRQSYYTYTQFPHFKVLQGNLTRELLFPKRLRNLKGAAIRTVPHSRVPANIVYRQRDGSFATTGYLASTLKTFAKKHNARLEYAIDLQANPFLLQQNVSELIFSGALDIPMALFYTGAYHKQLLCSNIIDFHSMHPMLPYPRLLEGAEIFVLLFKSYLTLVMGAFVLGFAIMLTLAPQLEARYAATKPARELLEMSLKLALTTTLRGMLAQTMHFQPQARFGSKLVYVLLLFAGINNCTTITAYLQTYLTDFPAEARITTVAQLRRSAVKIDIPIMSYRSMKDVYGADFFSEFEDAASLLPNRSLQMWQDNLVGNRAHGHVVSNSLWPVWERCQERLTRPIYYVPEDIFVVKRVPVSIPLPRHSIYLAVVNTLIEQLQESGILDYWKRNSFNDMYRAGMIPAGSLAEMEIKHVLDLADFYWVGVLYAAGLTLAFVAFVMEIMLQLKEVSKA